MGNPIYVDCNATGANDGTSWENAYNFLQDALADAKSAEKPVEIWVAQCAYTPDSNTVDPNGTGDREATFQLVNGVSIYGGFPSGGAEFGKRDPNLCETTLSGDLDGNDIFVSDPCDPNRAENSYHVLTGSSTARTSVLDGFTITRGNANGKFPKNNCGGGMYNISGYPTLTNCTFSGSSALTGGGIYNSYSDPNLTNCTFIDNSAEYDGGGMCNDDFSNPTLTNCTFSNNSAGYSGGGMYNFASKSKLANCIFNDNSAESGGGISNTVYSRPTLTNCTFSNNSARDGGGGMYIRGSNPILTNCTFSNNSAEYSGGGMYNYASNSKLTNCIFNDNSAESGGGIYNYKYSNLTAINCTFAQNSAQNGKALACDSSLPSPLYNVVMSNCILWDGGNEIWNNDNTTINVTYSDVLDKNPNNVYPGTGNINADPFFAELGYWSDVNYPNIVVEPNDPNAKWIDGDYHLKSVAGRWDPNSKSWVQDDFNSPCIDAGDPNTCIGFEPNPNGSVVNMGAYGGTAEASLSPSGVNCISTDHPDYDEWVQVGEPVCWCYHRQCHGDTDCKSQGKEIEGQIVNNIPLICADFDHNAQGKNNYRVSVNDLDILIANWHEAEKPDPNCP
jgi:parallel beta-helix repeat protein